MNRLVADRLTAVRITEQGAMFWRIMNWWRYRNTKPFIVTKIKKGVVTAVEMNPHTYTPLPKDKPREIATFDHKLADYLAVGDITVLKPSGRTWWVG